MGRSVCKGCGHSLWTEAGSEEHAWREDSHPRAHLWEMVPSKFLSAWRPGDLPPAKEFEKRAVLVWWCPECGHLQQFP